MKFSERKGYKQPSKTFQKEGMNEDLRTSIWNALEMLVWGREEFMWKFQDTPKMVPFSRALWFRYFKKPINEIPKETDETLQIIRKFFFSAEWYEVYDFLEVIFEILKEPELYNKLNFVLERELSAYRFVGEVLTDITAAEEIAVLEEALSDSDFPNVRSHLKRALELLSDRHNPDYRNSIKESIDLSPRIRTQS